MRPLDSVRNLPNMIEATYDLVAQVPEGMVTTYGEVAKALGDIVASRFVGLAMSLNQDIVRVPCRRVVLSDGSIGGYTGGGSRKKTKLLRQEGVKISGDKIVDFDQVLFKDFKTERPLADLRNRQRRLKRHLITKDFKGRISRVAGVDVAYEGDRAFAAMAVFDLESGWQIEEYVVEGDATFPYIPTYLAFREIPVIEPLMDHVGHETILMYDGNGILHPEGFGIASHLGLVLDVPTIGIAKKLLCGEVARYSANSAEVRLEGEIVGHALRASEAVKPVFVSAGHKISPRQSKTIAAEFLRHRIPEPTRRAHIAAEAARRATNHK